MLALIDGDIFRYRCAFAAERNYYLVELTNANGHKEYTEFQYKKEATDYGTRVVTGVKASFITWQRKDVQPLENALQICKTSLEGVLADVKAKQHRIFLSGPHNFRTALAVTKPYKGNRTEAKPTYYKEVGEYLVSQYGAETTDGIEADDAIGIAAMEAKTQGREFVVVSNDKDLDQIPGQHYDWVKKDFYNVSAKEAKTAFFTQLLSGDAVDNIPGLPGVGKVTAAKMLAECKNPDEMWAVVRKEYEKRDFPPEYLEEQQKLVEILKKPNAVH